MLKSQALQHIIDVFDSKISNYKDVCNWLGLLKEIVAIYPETSEFATSALMRIIADENFDSSLSPLAADVFMKIEPNIPAEKIVETVNKIYEKNQFIACQALPHIIQKHPDTVDVLFPKLLQDALGWEPASLNMYETVLGETIALAPAAQASQMFNQIFDKKSDYPQMRLQMFKRGLGKKSDYTRVRWLIYPKLGLIYTKHPQLREQILDSFPDLSNLFRHSPSRLENSLLLNKIYDSLLQIYTFDNRTQNRVQELLRHYVTHPNNFDNSLSQLYLQIGNILKECPGNQDEGWEQIIRIGLKNPVNTPASIKNAWRALEEYDKLRSTYSLGQRVARNKTYPNAWKDNATISPKETCVLVLGGDGVIDERSCNSYLREVFNLLEDYKLEKKVNIYGTVYDFGDYMNREVARDQTMEDYRHKKASHRILNQDTANPFYIEKIFNEIFLPRIATADNQKLPVEKAAVNIRRLNIVAHCHGAYNALKLEELMQTKMKELGYTSEERRDIQRQLLVLAYAPYCPLGVSKSNFISFVVADDKEIRHYNNFETAIHQLAKKKELPISYFPGNKGNMFITGNIGRRMDQHNFMGFYPRQGMNANGDALISFFATALINGVKNSLGKNPRIPDIAELVTFKDQPETIKNFQKACNNGQAFYKKILTDIQKAKKMSKENNY